MFPLYDNNPHRHTPWFTLLIIAANLGMTVYLGSQPEVRQQEIIAHFGFVPARIEQLSNPQLIVEVQLDDDVRPFPRLRGAQPPEVIRLAADPPQIYLSIFTMLFLHGGWLHVLGNMWFLWIFGNNIEDRLGHVVYLMFYLLGGLFSVAVHYFTDPLSTIPCIGASGAVAAVLGAYALTYPWAKVRTLVFFVLVDIPALIVLGLWFVQQLLSALDVWNVGMNGGVAWWAHVGGFAAGLLLMPVLALGAPPPDADWQTEAKRMFDFD